ncbi:hypothetical protein [Dryocola sp. BD626]|uniref:hypothetical protein n=1 Tax=Dryocola sp. BD626 TaxID=3133273 RepID=UPI003F4F8E23
MDIKEWVDGLRWLSADQVVDVHFKLQEQIKKHYKLRSKGNNLKIAIHLCEQQVALAEIALPALRGKWERDFNGVEFYTPAHHGYRQLITIMKKQKNLERVAELEAKMDAEGWRS